MGFFAFIREGVRRSVLLGFSDAVAELGNRQPGEDLGEHLAATLRQGIALDAPAPESIGASGSVAAAAGPRKRLGKSLEQIREAGQSANGPHSNASYPLLALRARGSRTLRTVFPSDPRSRGSRRPPIFPFRDGFR